VRLMDTASGYGWISIALHWLAAAVVLAMWTIGTLSQSAPEGDTSLADLHTTVGVSAYLLLWVRIVWRFAVGHPGPRPRQAALLFPLAKYFHFLMLAALGVMLLSGPLMLWSAGEAIKVFSLAIPSPLPMLPGAGEVLFRIHAASATVIILGIALHVMAVFKHMVANRDGTFEKIMIADAARRD
jgi:cytochrome b561